MGLQKHIEKGSPKGRRDMLRIAGTGCICSELNYREAQVKGKPMGFLNVRVVSNSVRNTDDGGANQYSEFTDLMIAGGRAKALAGILEMGQIIEFSGELRSSQYDSDRYFRKADDGSADITNPYVIHRQECVVGQNGWINIMKGASEATRKKNEETKKALEGMTGSGVTATPADLAGVMSSLLEQLKVAAAATPAATPAETETQKNEEVPLDLGTGTEVIDDDIPF